MDPKVLDFFQELEKLQNSETVDTNDLTASDPAPQ